MQIRDARPPTEAIDHRGNDVTQSIAEKDRLYPSEFMMLPFKGYAEPHSLTLDLGEIVDGEHVVLLLYGWIDYTDSSSNLAAWQAGVSVRTPYLEVEDGESGFRMAIEQMGFPAGLPKTMLVDLKGIVDARHRRVRITTSQRIYWDQILVATVVPDIDLQVTELAPDRAELGFRGYPASVNPDGRAPNIYDYSRISPTEVWESAPRQLHSLRGREGAGRKTSTTATLLPSTATSLRFPSTPTVSQRCQTVGRELFWCSPMASGKIWISTRPIRIRWSLYRSTT